MDTSNNAGEFESRIIGILDCDLLRRSVKLDIYRTSDVESEDDSELAQAIEKAIASELSEIFPVR